MCLIVKATSWMDRWSFALKSLALRSSGDSHLLRRLILAGGGCQLLVAKTTSTLWANIVLKRRNAILTKVKDSVSFESLMDLLNAQLSSTDHFTTDVLEKAVVRSSSVLHDEAIRKVVTQEYINRMAKNCSYRSFLSCSGNSCASSSSRSGKRKKF